MAGADTIERLRQFLREVVTLEQLASPIPKLPAPPLDGAPNECVAPLPVLSK